MRGGYNEKTMDQKDQLLQQVLILRFQTGDDRAFEAIVTRHQGPLRYWLRQMLGDSATVEDLLQEIWLTVLRKLRTLRNPEAFSVWLYKIARNKVYRQLRQKKTFVDFDENDLPTEDCEEQNDFSPADAAKIHKGLDQLKPEHREVLVLQFLEEMSYEEIASVVDCNVGTVRSRIFYAKKSLRKIMEEISDEK
jgi:RNA polymerase sigma-70 factor (ECF subfamily)